ncbi:MAG TPA: hypothetical protein VGO86_08985 [Candidatus Dormibacteraeota bacterium]|jgi:hypothetical protein
MRVWARGTAALLAATVACVVSWSLLSVVLPTPVTAPRPGPVLETVAPAQLVAMGVRLDPTLQPVELPDRLSAMGARLPSTIVRGSDAEATVRRNSGGVRVVTERALTYATVTSRGTRPRGPSVVHRLVWAVVGTRAAAGSLGGLLQVMWLVDARRGEQLVELAVLAAAPSAAAASPSGGAGP